MIEPIMRRLSGEGVEIQLAVWEGQGKNILCIHGLSANCRFWDVVASALAPRHRVLAMDLRGRGLSDKPPSGYSIENHCRDIKALLDGLGLDQAVLMGHSLGAVISLSFAAQHPEQVSRMILVDGGGELTAEQRAKVFAGIKPSLDRLGQIFPSFEAYLETMKKAPFLHPWSQAMETYFRYEVEQVEGGLRSRTQLAHIQEEVSNLMKRDAAPLYPKIQCPVLILRATRGMLAEDDLLLPEEVVERMIREIPDARRVDLAGTNHFTILFQQNENRDRAILDFLK
jgi:pimeloyl-ACP methyl ester carboxylesterase